MAIAGALLAGAPAEAVASQEPVPHILEIGTQEDSIGRDPHIAKTVFERSLDIKATQNRIIIRPSDLDTPEGWAQLDFKVHTAQEHNMNVHLVVGCNKRTWTIESYRAFVTSIMQRYPSVVRWSFWNEPNESSCPVKNAETGEFYAKEDAYRILYEVGEKTAQKLMPHPEVIFGELGSKKFPVLLFRKIINACPDVLRDGDVFADRSLPKSNDGENKCPPALAYRVGIHPYLFTKRPDSKRNVPGPNSRQVGINGLDVWAGEIDQAYVNGRIKTLDGNNPDLAITEITYLTEDSDGRLDNAGIPEWKRETYFPQALGVACLNKSVAEISVFGIYEQPDGWEGNWRSGIINIDGSSSPSFFAIKKWTDTPHDACEIKLPQANIKQ